MGSTRFALASAYALEVCAVAVSIALLYHPRSLRSVAARAARLTARQVRPQRVPGGAVSIARTAPPCSRVFAARPRSLLHRLLQFLGRPERDLLAGLDLDGLASRRIPSHTCRPLPHPSEAIL